MLGVVLVSNVEFKDYSVQVKSTLQDLAVSFLYEAGGEIESGAKRNSRVKTSKTKGSFRHIVDESGLSAHIGSDEENAIWEEFGTGLYAINGDGRKGGWFYVDDEGKGHFTRGKRPSRALWNAFMSLRGTIESMARERFGDLK